MLHVYPCLLIQTWTNAVVTLVGMEDHASMTLINIGVNAQSVTQGTDVNGVSKI